MTYQEIENIVSEDFAQFDVDDWVASHMRKRHIQLATKLALDFARTNDNAAVRDFIHGLNHIFFFGYCAR